MRMRICYLDCHEAGHELSQYIFYSRHHDQLCFYVHTHAGL
jgi:hypothetical protein